MQRVTERAERSVSICGRPAIEVADEMIVSCPCCGGEDTEKQR